MKINKIKRVLIALDYHPNAHKVAEQGFSIAKSMEAEIILLHVVSNPENYIASDHITIMGFAGKLDKSALQSESMVVLKELSRKYLIKSKEHLGDSTIQTIVGEGDIADSILKTAKDEHADIIIMGSHGRKSLEYVIIGSITGKVLHNTILPLIIIPTKD
jgi:nucleotide-binding universal stress UspA family protein